MRLIADTFFGIGMTQPHAGYQCGFAQRVRVVWASPKFIDNYDASRTYSQKVKQHCLKLYVNGMGFRAVERVTGVHHTTIIYWVKQVGEKLEDAPEGFEIPQVGELDELETFVGAKKTSSGSGR